MDNSEVKKLYDALIKKGYTTRDLGDAEVFAKKISDEQNRKQLYDYVVRRGDFRIGDYDTYERRLTGGGAKKTDGGGAVSAAAPTSTATPTTAMGPKPTETLPGPKKPVAPDGFVTSVKMPTDGGTITGADKEWTIPTTDVPEETTEGAVPGVPDKPLTEQDKIRLSVGLNNMNKRHEATMDALKGNLDNMTEWAENVKIGEDVAEGKPMLNPETGEMEKTYITPTARRYFDKPQATAEASRFREAVDMTTSGRLRRAQRELRELERKAVARHREISETHKPDGSSLLLSRDPYANEYLNDKELRMLNVAITEKEKTIGELEDQLRRDRGEDPGLWHQAGRVMSDPEVLTFGLESMRKWSTIKNSKPDDSSTPEEDAAYQEMLSAINENEQTAAEFADNWSNWERWGQIFGHVPFFGAELLLTGGGFKGIKLLTKMGTKLGAKAIGKEAAEEMAKQGVIKYIKSNGWKGVGNAALNGTIKSFGVAADELLFRAPLVVNTIHMPQTIADIYDRKYGDIVENEKGELGFANDKNWSAAIWESEADNTIEVYSEMFGEHLDGVMSIKGWQKASEVLGLKRLSGVLAKAEAGELGTIINTTRKWLGKAGVNSYIGEVGEEYYGQLLRTGVNLDEAYRYNEDGTRTNLFFDSQWQGDIWGGMLISQGLLMLPGHAISAGRYMYMKHRVNRADARAAEAIGAETWGALRDIIDNTTNDAMGEMAVSIMNDASMSQDARDAAINYIGASLRMRGFNLGTMAQGRNGTLDNDAQALNESYVDGYNAVSAQERNDANNMYNRQRERVLEIIEEESLDLIDSDVAGALDLIRDSDLDEEQRGVVLEYLNAKQVRDGMMQRVRDDIDGRIEQSNAMVDARTNKNTGMIHPATMKQDGRKVYVVSGNLVQYDDGSGIDSNASDDSIIVRDAETGKLEQVSPDAILNIDETIDPAQEKETTAEQIRQQYARQAANDIDGVITFNAGDTYEIPGAVQGQTISLSIVANEEGIVDNGDGTVNVSMGGRVFPMAKESLQAQVNAVKMQRIYDFERKRAEENLLGQQQSQSQPEQPQTETPAPTPAPQQSTPTPTPQEPVKFNMDDEVTLRDADGNTVQGRIISGEEDGRYQVETDTPLNGRVINNLTADEISGMLIEHNGEAIAQPEASPQETPAPQQEQSAYERVPKNENEEPLYEQTDSDTAWDAIVEQAEGDEEMAQAVADSMVADKEAELKKIEKSKPKAGATIAEKIAAEKEHKEAIAAAQLAVEAWKKIAGTTSRRKSAAEAEAARAEAEAARARKAEEDRLRAEREEAERVEREKLNGVPDMTEDIPADARARGYRRVNGHVVERQQPVGGLRGKEVEVKFSDKEMPKGRVAVIEAEELQPSHLQGQRNPLHFIDEAQPKDRNDAASVASSRKIAGNIRPEEITTSVTAYTGAPTVNSRGEVIQGNSRSDALRLMWEAHPEQAAKYKQYLIYHAEEFGLNPEEIAAMKHPVLVGMLDAKDEDAIRLGQYVAQDTESGGIERIKPKNAVQKMGNDMRTFANRLLATADDDMSISALIDANGVEVLKWMNEKGYITPTQYKSAFDSRGNLTEEAKNDLRGIMYQSIFKGAPTSLEEMFNKLPIKAQRAILATAYRDYDSSSSERMIKEIQNSIMACYALLQTSDFAKATTQEQAMYAIEAWKRQYQIDDATGESYIPAKKFSNFALHLAMMYKVCSQNTIQGTFNKMYDLIQGTQAANLFEAPDNTPRTLAQAIKETLNIDYNGQNGSNLLAGDNTASQRGEQGSPRDTKSGESDKGGERTADSGARTEGNGEQVERPKKGGEQRAESGEATVERQKPQNSNVPTLFDAITTLYEKGKEVASKLFQRTYFYVARTPKFMQELGLRGDKFTIKYGVISRHLGKDGSHTLTEKEWTELPDALQKPFAISKITDEEDSYRIYTTLQTSNGEYVVVGVDVKNAGREIEVNAISTVFGRRDNANLPKNEKVIYRSEEITPEQSSLLERPNYARYPNAQELSVDKGRKKSGTVQEPEGEKDMLRRKWETMKRKMPEGTVFIVEHNGRYYAFGDDATRVNAALTGKGDAARTDYISLDEKQYNDVIEVLDLKGFSIASYSAKDIKEEEQPVEGLPDKLQSIVNRLLELKSEMDRYREIGNKAEGDEALEADEKYDELNNEASEFVKSLDTLSLEELNKVFDELGEKRYAFEWDFAKLFDKKKTEEAQMRNREKARAAVQAVMDADLPKVKVGNPKFNIHNYTDGTSKSTPAIGGIFHDNGYAVATDTHIVVASKEDYDAEHEGQLVTKDGDVLHYKFPKWRLVLNPDPKAMENPMPFDCDALLGFIASVEAKLKADKMGPKKIAGTMQLVRLPNGDVGAVDLSTLKNFAIAAKHFGAKEIAINGRRDVIYTSTEKGSVMIYFNLTAGQGHFDYEEAGKTTFGFDMSGKKQREQIEQEQAKERNGEDAKPAPKDAVETTVPKNSQKIEDFGEKINGARKDLVNDIVKKLEQSNPESFAALQLTKAFSRPKIKELIDTGAITEKEAVYIEALSVLVLGRKKPVATKRYGRKEIEEWANEQAQVVEKMKSFIETDADTRAEIIASLKKEYEQCLSTGEAISPVAFAYAVIERAGLGDKSGYKPVDLHVKQQWGKQYTIRAGHGYVYVVGKNLEEAVSTQVAALQIKNGVSDVEFPMHLFKVGGRGRMYVGVGTYEVIYNSKSRTGRKSELFKSKEEAEAFAKNKKDAYVVEQTKTQYTSFEICIKDPVSHTDVELGITFESKEEANAYIEEHLLELSNKAAEKIFKENKTEREGMKYFEVHKSYVDGKYFVTAMGMQWILDEFDTLEEAKQKAQELEDEYKKLVEEQKKIVYFSTKESKREGKDWRDGKDATPEMFMKAFGFRGVQFGNWTNARDRQEALNQAYDAFMDLAEVLGKSPKTMSLNGELGLAFGARGSGSALAHYEPGEVVINLTKTKGAGSLAHEWWHALDNYLSRRVGVASGFATALRGEKLREELKDAIGDLLRAIDTEADYGQRSRAMGAYWGSTIEITARLFAEYVNKKIRDKGEKNAFLSRGVSPSAIEKRKEINWRRYQLRVSRLISRYGSKADFKPMTKEEFMKSPDALAGFPHPTDVEVEKLSPYLDKFFAELKESEEMLYHKAEGKDVEIGDVLPDEAAMRDALIDRLEKSGIQVVTESEEAQAVLDAAKGNDIANAKKRALETVSVTSSEEHLQTVVSSADGAKVLNNLDNLAKKIEETIHPTVKTFIGDAAEALGAKRKGSGSQYATFETVNGKLVTIRLSDHNAKVSNFDNNGEFEGISIVISAKGNNGVIDDGDAHITEYYYDSIKLRKSKEKPLAEIVRSIKQALYSGEFKDTTGLAEMQEVNMPPQRKTNVIKLQKREQSVEEKQYKEKQLEIINKSNPAPDSYHTWVRSTDDILTLQEAVDEVLAEDEEYELSSYPDVSDEMIREALRTGKIRVYSSKPIKNGVFVTPSMMQAKDYAGRGAVYSKEVPISDVAWINTDEGQYAATSDNANEKDTGIKYFRTSNGEVYGFTDMKKIYIDRKIAGAETPIHEYTHLWAQAMRNANPEEWRNIIELMRGTNEWEQVKKNYPELTTDDEVAEEVLAHYSGRRGAERLRAEQKKVLESDASVLDKAAAVDSIERVKQALSKFWKAVSEWFDVHFTSAEEVADKVLYDMLNGENFGNAGVNIKSQEIIGRSLSADEAEDFVTDMEDNADTAPDVDLTIENWNAQFGAGTVNTPIGEVKMGENQFAKLMRKGRNGKLGMIKPTLENPDVIVEDASEAKHGNETERASSYVFIRSFKKADGSRFYHFTSITVSKNGKEVVISNQEKSRNKILRLLQEGKVIWHTPKDVTTSSAERQGLDYEQLNMAETATKGSGITPQRTPSYGKDTTNTSTNNAIGENNDTTLFESDDTMYRVRTDEPPTKTGTGYKVFVLKNGKLYPPMVANPGGDATPVGIWLDADAAPITGQSKTGRDQVKAGGKGTQGGSGSLAYRPGWHLGEIPYALQFNRKDENGEKTLFPGNFVWAEVEYANDVDYQEEAMQYGYTEKGKFRHSYAGLPRLPINGAYRYRTNPNPETDPWIITGAMRVKRLLTPSEVDNMVMEAGREPQRREASAITDADIETLNKEIEANSSTSQEVMVARVRELAEKLNLGNVDIVTDANALEGKKATAKGFYSKSTGRITIVIPNNANAADVEQTLLHEAVAHYGLRQLFGEHFDTFLDNVFNNASEEVRKKIVELAAKNGWDFRKATEEYLATLAESTEFDKIDKGFWRKVKNFFLEMLDKIGLKGFSGVTLTDNELRYILWRSYENLREPGGNRSVFGEAADIAKQYELQVGNYASENSNNETLFRDGDPVQRERAIARSVYDARVRSGMYQTIEALQDSMLGLKEAMNAIAGEKYVEEIDGFENAYIGENRLAATNKAEADAFAHILIKPMLEEIAALARNEEEYKALTDYMMAKHGLERNEYMRAEAIKRGEIGANERDFAGLTALTGTSDTYVAEQMAKRMVSDYEQDHDTTALWEKVNAVSKALLQKSYDCGMMNKETYEKVRDMYEYYIPLRGFDEATGEDVYSYLSSNNRIGAPLLKTAKGRKSKADDPIANLCLMADSTIMQGNRNKLVKQRFLNFVLNHPSDLVSVSDLWLEYNNVNDEWVPVFPNNIESQDSPEYVERKMQDFETKMRGLAKQYPKRYKRSRDAKDMPYRILEKRDMREHIVIVKRNGRDYVLIINGNPRAAQAVNGLTNPDNDAGLLAPILKSGEWVNRRLSALYTTYNPDFVASNFIRDLIYTNMIVWVKEDALYATRYHKNYMRVHPGKMLKLIKKYNSGKLDMSDKLEAQFHEFMMNGGETGFANIRDIEDQKSAIREELKGAHGVLKIKKALMLLKEQLDDLNRAAENCARFAAFITSRDIGRSLDRSIYDAKEISVNFNKKGSGAKFLGKQGQTVAGNTAAFVSGAGRAGYVFWNAGIQGLTNFGRQAKRHPAKAFVASATLFMLGALAAYLGRGDDDDDDKEKKNKTGYYDLPQFVRRSNLLFKAGDSWIAIPLPIEYRAIYGMGELMMSVIGGKEHLTGAELAHAIAGQVTQVLPIDFMEGGGANAFIPSAGKPVYEAYVNKSWTGLPIYKDTAFNKEMPEWTKAYSSNNKILVNLAAALNEATGGDKYTKGAVDINPAQLGYMLNGYFGGISSTIDRMTKLAATASGDMEYDPSSLPVLNRFIKAGDERTEYRAVNREYARLEEEYNVVAGRLRGYENDTDNGIFNFAEKIDFLENSPEYRRYLIFGDYKQEIDDLYQERKEAATEEERKQIESEINELKRMLVEEVEATRNRE